MSYTQIMHELELDAKKNNIPISGVFELSSACNLKCKFCYAKQRNNKVRNLSIDEWKNIIRDCVNCGLLRATFTGGEPLTRKDFMEIYSFTYDLGVRITILSNGLLFDDDICAFLSERKPEGISITMYGICDEDYEKICGTKKGFKIFNEKINLLTKYKLPVSLKVLAIPELKNSLLKMKEYATKHDLKISLTKYISPYIGAKNDFRLSAQEIQYYAQFFDNANDVVGGVKETNNLCSISKCSAAKSRFAITPDGYLLGCLCYPYVRVKINKGFGDALKEIKEILSLKGSNCMECLMCPYNSHCNKCPGLNYMETGDETKCSKYRKELAAKNVL